ncbi:MAG: BrnA antitoxin family protein [Alphaproteobacteria bacterium]
MQIPDVREEEETVRVTITLDRRVYDWFRQTGRGYQKRMNRALLWYIDQLEEQDAAADNDRRRDAIR